jgi:hypothetical protein
MFFAKKCMKKTLKIALAVSVIVAIGVIATSSRKKRATKMLDQVADEGYETAHDILFPGKKTYKKELRYGPVLPS